MVWTFFIQNSSKYIIDKANINVYNSYLGKGEYYEEV